MRLATSDLQLENFVMLKWTEDQTVIPRGSRFTIIGIVIMAIMEIIIGIVISFSSSVSLFFLTVFRKMSQIRNDFLKWADGGDSNNNDRENESEVEIIRDLRHCQCYCHHPERPKI